MKKLFFLLIAVIFISGCTIPQFGIDVIKVEETQKEEGFRDVLVVKDIETLPKSPVIPSEAGRSVPVVLSFVIENKDDRKHAEGVAAEIFDPGSFDIPAPSQSIGNILPQAERMVRFDMTSPRKERLAGLKTTTEINFRVDYDYKGFSLFEFPVVDFKEIVALQRAGESVKVPRGIFQGSGPIQMQIDILGSKYVLNGQRSTVTLRVFNRGDKTRGTLIGSEIKPEKLRISFPAVLAGITPPEGDNPPGKSVPADCVHHASKLFCCVGRAGGTDCRNIEPVPLYKGESPPLLFVTEPATLDPGVPYRTFQITSEVEYTYELRGSKSVEITPLPVP